MNRPLILAALLALGLAWPAAAQAPEADAAGEAPLPQVSLTRGEVYVEGRIAFLKAELKLNDAQAKAFEPVAEAMRAAATARAGLAPLGRRPDLPARVDRALALAEAEGTVLKQLAAALAPFYASLDDTQKARADALHDLLP